MKFIVLNEHVEPAKAIGPFNTKGAALDWAEGKINAGILEINAELPDWCDTFGTTDGETLTVGFFHNVKSSSGHSGARKAYYTITPLKEAK